MRIAWAVPLIPYPPNDGGSIRLYQLLTNLASRHAIHLLALSNGTCDNHSMARLRELCSSFEIFDGGEGPGRRGSWPWWRHHWTAVQGPAVSYYRHALHARLRSLVRRGQVDVILLETLKMSGYGIPAPLTDPIDRVCRTRTILCRQNYEADLAKRMAAVLPISRARDKAVWSLGAHLLREIERRVVSQYRWITAVSEREAAVFRRLSPEAEVMVVPNGADLRAPSGPESLDDGRTVAMIGSLHYPPNQDAARHFHQRIWPLIRREQADARLLIVGRAAREHLGPLASDPSVEVRDPGSDPRHSFSAATVVVVPLRAGAGTRVKILEALAAGKAVVSTTVGCEGLDLVAGRDLIVSDEPRAFARDVVTLLRDARLRRTIGASGRALVVQRYTWSAAADALESFCDRVAGSSLDAGTPLVARHA